MARLLELCLFVCVALVLISRALGQWTGYVNSLTSTLNYNCSSGTAVGGIASDFRYIVIVHIWLHLNISIFLP